MTIEQRLRRLERHNSILAGVLLVSAAGAACLTLMGQSRPSSNPSTVADVIRARRFEVVNERGVQLVVCQCSKAKDGSDIGAIETRTENGQSLVLIYGEKDGTRSFGEVSLLNEKHNELVGLGCTGKGYGRVWTGDPDGQETVLLAGTESGGGILTFNHSKALIRLSADNGGSGLFVTYGANGKERVTIQSTDIETGSVSIHDANGGPIVGLTATRVGEGNVVMYDRTGKVNAHWP